MTIRIIYGHNFSPNTLASFIASIDQFQTEINLVNQNLINNHSQLTQKHANEANSIFYWDLLAEIAKRDQKISDAIKSDIKDLQNISTSHINSNSSRTSQNEELKIANQLVANINTNMNSIVNITKEQIRVPDSNVLDQITIFLSNLFTDQNSEDKKSFQPMRFVELIDELLRNYGDAYDVDFDMTDMSNMGRMMNNNSSRDLNNDFDFSHSMHTPSAMMSMHPNASPLVSVANYQSAKGLTEKLIDIFDKDLKPLIPNNYNTNIENSLRELLYSIENQFSPTDTMMIV
ncbi:MAG: hypothetical protein L0H55_04845, partial [Candidatus Nitrosocosmicus sp.]|nr:hypothetical protein [Candidatus Nitrosocosmicus sp.]